MNDIINILKTGNSDQKIRVLESLTVVNTNTSNVIKHIIDKLDDDDIKVRGEAFSSLLLNKSEEISEHLIKSLNSTSKNIRGFASLALANRNDSNAIPELIRLACDESSMVRSCAIGALGHLGANDTDDMQNTLYNALFDKSAKVKKSAAQAIIKTGIIASDKLLENVSKEWKDDIQKDAELGALFDKLCAK